MIKESALSDFLYALWKKEASPPSSDSEKQLLEILDLKRLSLSATDRAEIRGLLEEVYERMTARNVAKDRIAEIIRKHQKKAAA